MFYERGYAEPRFFRHGRVTELVRTHAMADVKMKDEHNIRANDSGAPPDSGSTLLPMLIWGLVLIIAALIAVTMFV